MIFRHLLAVSSLIGLCACTVGMPSEEDVSASLQAATAEALAASDPQAITIEESEKTPVRWEWKARHEGKAYVCNADNRMRLPDCSQTS